MPEPGDFTPIGQPLATLLINKMLETGRVGGSYLFSGPQGVGKKTMVRFLAMAVNCETPPLAPCGVCPACRKILTRNHPDFMTLFPLPGKQTIAIDQVRELQKTLSFGPYEGKRRVVMVDPAERLGLEAANALLITLESPPEHTLLVLITSSPYALLETIRSRCQVIRFTPLPRRALMDIARRGGVPVSPDDPALELCQGSATRLLTLLQPDIREIYTEMDLFLKAVMTGRRSADLIDTPKWAKQRETMEIFLERGLWFVRDWAVSMEGQTDREVVNKKLIRDVRSAKGRVSRASLLALADALFQSMEELKRNAAPELLFDTLRIKMEAIIG